MEAKLIKVLEHYHLYDGDKAIATTIVGNPMLLPNISLKNCQAIENGYDLDELANKYISNNKIYLDNYKEESHSKVSFIDGFQKAIEILGDKKFSEDDVKKAILLSMKYNDNAVIKSLQQTEWDVEIVMEKVKDETKIVGSVKGVKGSGDKITTYKSIPKLDTDGCLILRKI